MALWQRKSVSSSSSHELTPLLEEAVGLFMSYARETGAVFYALQKKISAELAASSKKLSTETASALNLTASTHASLLKKLHRDLEKASEAHLEAMEGRLANLLSQTELRLSSDISRERAAVVARLQTFEKDEKTRISTSLAKSLPAIIEEVLGRGMTLEKHEKLIESALEKVSKDINPIG